LSATRLSEEREFEAGPIFAVSLPDDENLARDLKYFRHSHSDYASANIAVVHDFDIDHGVDFLVMEHIPGAPLSEWLAWHELSTQDIVVLRRNFVQPEPMSDQVPSNEHRHSLPGYQVVKRSVLGGLHHEYELKKEVAERRISFCGLLEDLLDYPVSRRARANPWLEC